MVYVAIPGCYMVSSQRPYSIPSVLATCVLSDLEVTLKETSRAYSGAQVPMRAAFLGRVSKPIVLGSPGM